LENLERSLRQYLAQPSDSPFDLGTVSAVPEAPAAPVRGAAPTAAAAAHAAAAHVAAGAAAASAAAAIATSGFSVPEAVAAALPTDLGAVQSARGPTALTERQIEIQVRVYRSGWGQGMV
jgi:hypothetical protein